MPSFELFPKPGVEDPEAVLVIKAIKKKIAEKPDDLFFQRKHKENKDFLNSHANSSVKKMLLISQSLMDAVIENPQVLDQNPKIFCSEIAES